MVWQKCSDIRRSYLGLILRTILEEICTGKKVFTPEAGTQEAMEKFQQIAKAISFADSEELVEQCQFGIEDFSERLTFSKVMVTGGVTEKGQEFLRSALLVVSKKLGKR